MKKSGNILLAILGFAFVICIPAAFIFGYLNNLDYEKNGTAVECEVYAYETLGRHTDIWVNYTGDDGVRYEAHVENDSRKTYIGEKFTGYVMPDEPTLVYRKQDKALVGVMFAICTVCVALGIWAIVALFKGNRESKLIEANGIRGECVIVEVTMQKLGRGNLVYPAKFRYTDEFGNEHTDTHVFEMRPPELGDKYNVIYARKSNGRYTARIDK